MKVNLHKRRRLCLLYFTRSCLRLFELKIKQILATNLEY